MPQHPCAECGDFHEADSYAWQGTEERKVCKKCAPAAKLEKPSISGRTKPSKQWRAMQPMWKADASHSSPGDKSSSQTARGLKKKI